MSGRARQDRVGHGVRREPESPSGQRPHVAPLHRPAVGRRCVRDGQVQSGSQFGGKPDPVSRRHPLQRGPQAKRTRGAFRPSQVQLQDLASNLDAQCWPPRVRQAVVDLIPPHPASPVQKARGEKRGDRAVIGEEYVRREIREVVVTVIDGERDCSRQVGAGISEPLDQGGQPQDLMPIAAEHLQLSPEHRDRKAIRKRRVLGEPVPRQNHGTATAKASARGAATFDG